MFVLSTLSVAACTYIAVFFFFFTTGYQLSTHCRLALVFVSSGGAAPSFTTAVFPPTNVRIGFNCFCFRVFVFSVFLPPFGGA